MIKFLIDECLTPELAQMAQARGHYEASHVRWIGKQGWKDWQLKPVFLEEGWVLVTRNGSDFRGPREMPGSQGQYADVELQPGLICVTTPGALGLKLQCFLFEKVLDSLEEDGDLINRVLEIECGRDGTDWKIERYDLPKSI